MRTLCLFAIIGLFMSSCIRFEVTELAIDQDGDGYTADNDCNDNDSTISPGQEEPCICDDIDQDCDGETQNFCCDLSCEDADGDGYPGDSDCNDGDPTIHPDQDEPCTCDAVDQNCNGVVDDCPCGIKCDYLQEGEGCGLPDQVEACDPSLLCCYPCGIPGCENRCTQPEDGECPIRE
jgi:hypothetical protein